MIVRPNSSANVALLLVALVSLGACSSSGTGTADSGDVTTSGTTDTGSTDGALEAADAGSADGAADAGGSDGAANSGGATDANSADGGGTTAGQVFPVTGEFDLSEYLFHRNVLTIGGEISFLEKFYDKTPETDEDGSNFLSLSRAFFNNAGVIEESSFGELDKTFLISATTIDETFVGNGDFRQSQRFASVGDEYLNADTQPMNLGGQALQQNATCIVQEHFNAFDLSTATDDRMLASGVYEDVLKVEGFTKEPYFKDVSFNLRKGEILGISGLIGAGRTEVLKTIFGYSVS